MGGGPSQMIFVLGLSALIGVDLAALYWPRWRKLLLLCAVSVALLLAVSIFQLTECRLFKDFNTAYYHAGYFSISDPSRLYDESSGGLFVNLPLIALCFEPLAKFPPSIAQWIYFAVGMMALVYTIWFNYSVFPQATLFKRVILLEGFLSNGPLINSIREGNTTHLILLVLGGAIFKMEQSPAVCGCLFALAAAFKPALLLFGVYLVVRGQVKAAIAFWVTMALVLVLSITIFGIGAHDVWYLTAIRPFESYSLAAFNVQSFDGFTARLLSNGHLYSWKPVILSEKFALMRWSARIVILVCACVVGVRAGKPRLAAAQRLECYIVICIALIASPISWSHYYALLLIPYADAVLSGSAMWQKKYCWILGGGFLLCSLPLVPRGGDGVLGDMMASPYLIGGIIILIALLVMRCDRALGMRSADIS